MMFLDTEHPLASVSLSGRFRAASVRPPAKMVPVLAGPAEVVCHRPLVSADTPLSSALARACDLSINDFEILLRLDDRDAFNGPAERWAETLTTLHTESQMNAFVFWPSGDRERQSRLFAEQVVPAARESLARLASQP